MLWVKRILAAVGLISIVCAFLWAMWIIVQIGLVFYAFYKGGHPF